MARRAERDVDELAASLLAAYDLDPCPPVDVEVLARHLGVESICRRRMIEDGRLEQEDGRVSIFIRQDVGPTRARFTLAHELAHLLLAGPERNFIAHRTWMGDRQEERFCDQFAAALLMPEAWVRSNFQRRPEGFSALKALADAAETSLSAALLRLRELAGWKSCLLRWNRDSDRWRLASSVGGPWRMRNRLTTTPATVATLDAINPGDRRFVSCLPIGVNGIDECVRAEVQVWSRSVAALADLESVLPAGNQQARVPSSPLSPQF